MKPTITYVFALCATLIIAAAATAQNLFAPVITINDRAITAYELQQRERFLTLLRAPGVPAEEARTALISDRLYFHAADLAGLRPTEEAVVAGMEEFAGRANLTAEQFVSALGQAGVDEETFRDFVRAGLAWRAVIQQRFGPRAQITEAEVDRALALATQRGGARVLLSEIAVPATPEGQALAEQLSRTLRGERAFAQAARRYSASPSGARGGRLDWVSLSTLSPGLIPILLTLKPGEVSAPLPIGDAIILFQVRAIEEIGVTPAETISIEYATLAIDGGRTSSGLAKAQNIINRLDTCDDLYGAARKMPEGALERVTAPVSAIPQDIALELAKMDANETSTALTRADGQRLLLVMLCGRTAELTEGGREEIRQSLINQRLASYANGYLEELRADAVIIEK